MEVTDDHVEVFGLMQILTFARHGESSDDVQIWIKDIYNYFTSIHKDIISMISKFRKPYKFYKLKMDAGTLIRFCRFSLKRRILEEDGITRNQSLAELLAEIEFHLINIVKNGTDQNISKRGVLVFMEDIMERIMEAYDQPLPISYLLIDYELTIEFIDQFLEDLDCLAVSKNSVALEENLRLLKNYLELLTKDRIYGHNLEKLLIAVENVAYDMARDFFEAVWRIKFKKHYISVTTEEFLKIQSGYRFGVLKALVVLPADCYSGDAPLMSDELLVQYVKCVQENLLELLKSNTIDHTNTLKVQLMILHERLSFLTHLLITYPPKYNSDQKEFSYIRLDFQALARNVGSVICSCFENPQIEEMGLGFIDLIETMDVIKGEIIKTICCMVLQKAERESPKEEHMGFLILLLQNLKDPKPGLIVNWKDHENLVLFTFYLIQNASSISDDEFSRNTLQLNVDLINHEELNGVLISAQVVAFNISCHSLLRRYGRFHWWELYLGTKEHVDMHMCVAILEAFVLSSTTPLTDELLIANGECVRDCLVELQRIEAFDPLRDQFNIIHEELSFIVRLLKSYMDEQDKMSNIKVGFQILMRSIGSVICSRFNYRVNDDTASKQSTNDELSNFLEKMNLIKSEIQEILPLLILSKIGRESPKTNQLGSLNLLLENWKGLMDCESDLITTWKEQFQMIHENMVLFKSFITCSSTGDDESQNLCSTIVDTGHVAEYLLTIFSDGTCPISCRDRWLLDLTERVELIKADVMKVNKKNGDMKEISIAGKDQSQVYAQALRVPTSTSTDVVVGFELEMKLIREELAGHRKQLDVISIVGMPGLGKTTLARKVFEDPFTINYFDVRAWCHVSQEYNTKDLLLAILGSKLKLTDEIRGKSETDLSVMVHKTFIGRRYFIVLDDIWDINTFMYLKHLFPDDNQGSRIMLTSRSKVIGSQAQDQFHGKLIEPHMLTDEQSWELMERKVYKNGKCPSELCQIGKEIARKCRGLPLAVVVVAGILAKGTHTGDFWEQVTGSLSTYLARDSQSQFMATLELSYKFLPDCLKPMFLYLGAFPETKEIHVDKLTRLWMAEGFVQKTESMSLEIQAETNLMDLIDRSLVMVTKRRWDGRVKVCHVHDLLRDMCLAIAKEEKFMQQVHMHSELPNPVMDRYLQRLNRSNKTISSHLDVHSELPDPVMYRQRLSIVFDRNNKTISSHFATFKDLSKFSITPPIYSLLLFKVGEFAPDFELGEAIKDKGDPATIISSLKLLRVFDDEIFNITQDCLDNDLIKLVHLRYASFSANISCIPLSISRLRSLETLIIKGNNITVPETIWEMTKLKHLHVYSSAIFSVTPDNPFLLENLQTLSTPVIDLGNEEILFKKVPGLKKLQCIFNCYRATNRFPNLKSLGKLESLRVSCSCMDKERLTGQFKLPLTLKKLSITESCMEWSQISIFHKLPNLEFLKLNWDAVKDDVWEMGDDDVFSNLKILKLDMLNIKRWSASSVNFPSLEKLVLEQCHKLEEIPSDLGEFDTLQEIKMLGCGSSAVEMAKAIEKEQEEFGNELLKFYF